ncbi:MAG TPA: PDGLE domain-containing protein [Methanocella sp.]|nr:PDGLE domain-containing protein [Methanocella sp.]
MDKKILYLIIGLTVLVILTPIGLIASGTAYGEWSADELQQAIGFVPSGFSNIADLWHAPLPDYGLPGQGNTLTNMAPGYWISAIIGVIITGGIIYVAGKFLIKNSD